MSHQVPGAQRASRDLLLGRLDLMRGRYHQVIRRLKDKVRTPGPLEFEARIVLGRALQAVGKRQEAYQVLDGVAQAYNQGRVKTAWDLTLLGVALQLTEYPRDASETFEEALRLAPTDLRPKVFAAALFLQKYNFQAADELYQEALKLVPGHVGALLGMATIDIESERDYSTARERLEQILTVSPECVPAHNLLARIDLENERLKAAMGRLRDHSLRLAPGNGEGLALLGAAVYLADDHKGFTQVERDARAVNPEPAGFYSTVSEHAS
ncbi:MAG: tetratricopeptide repeat protein, partial [Myxococcota bacterium]|nr:tetratricopeptide repeat protein [Myxococcota bacterium]